MLDILNAVPRRIILATGISIIAVLVFATIGTLAILRADTLDRAEWHLQNLVHVMGQQMRQWIQSVDAIVTATARDLEARLAGSRKFSDRELYEDMHERTRALPHVRNLSVIDREGRLTISSREFPAAGPGLADREYFRVLRDRAPEALHVGEPVVGRVTAEEVQPFSRAVRGPRGEFQGAVMAAVRLPYFEELFAELNLGAGGRVFIFREDGVLLAVHPGVDGVVGRSFADDPLFRNRHSASASGGERRAGFLSGEPRIVAYEPLKGYPLVVAVSSTEDFVLAGWRSDAWRIGAGAGVTAAFLGIALFFLMRQARVSAGLQHDLRETGAQLQSIIHSAMDAIVTVDERQRIVMFNEAAERIFRCPAADAVGGPLERFIPKRFRDAHRHHIEQFGRTGITTRVMGARLELFGLRSDGEEFPIDASISQSAVDRGKIYTVILRDVTERKRAETSLERSREELRALSATMNEVREAERARIARELHDELAQSLTALKMDVSWLSGRLPTGDDRARSRIERMKGLVDSTVTSVRRLAHDLRPAMLDDLGLVPAIEHLLHEFSERTGVVVELDADANAVEFREPLTTSVYRMVQEALTNVARHARATEVRVAIRAEGDELTVTASDNGVGVSAAKLQSGKSLGILGIKERAHTLGGKAEIHSPVDGGTVVEIRIPVRQYRTSGARA